ncbi:hypothetical protein vseg_016422 [Gypsophila vaccaria]
MAGLQRSAISFRRQGSSGLVWDDKLLSEELNNNSDESVGASLQQQSAEEEKKSELRRTRSDGGGGRRDHRSVKVEQGEDPPSPKVSGCGFCGGFGKAAVVRTDKRKKSGNVKHK